MKKRMQKNGKAKKQFQPKLGKRKFVIKDGIKFLIEMKKRSLGFNIIFKNDEHMRCFDNLYVQPKQFEELEQLKKSLTEEGLNNEEVSRQLKQKTKIFHYEMKINFFGKLIEDLEDKEEKLALKKELDLLQNRIHKLMNKTSDNIIKVEIPSYAFKENNLMTLFEDEWILKKALPEVQKILQEFKKRLIRKRGDGNSESDLNSEEQIAYEKRIKNLKMKEGQKLRGKLRLQLQKQADTTKSEASPAKKQKISKESKVLNGSAEKKSASTRSKSGSGKSCFNCNEVGHISKDCPKKGESGLASCFNCKEVGHKSKACPKISSQGGSKGASCFNCNEVGHMSRECPTNTNQNGSGATCYNCNEVGHMSRECPKKLKKGEGSESTCYEVGHMSRECPKKSERSGGSGSTCYNGNKVGHMSGECPKKSSQVGGSGSKCYNCNEVGHMSRECPKKSSQGGSGGSCYNCNETGHISRDCPKKSNRGGGSGSSCYNCNEVGHISRDCPQKSNRTPKRKNSSGGFSRGGKRSVGGNSSSERVESPPLVIFD